MKANRFALNKDQMELNIIALTRDATPLLKFGKSGKPGFRAFQLSSDLLSLTWQSKNKSAGKAQIDLKNMKEIRYGQRTEKFKRNNRPDLEHLSFSVMYDDSANGNPNESLDLVCKDEAEFQLWTATLSALIEGKIDRSAYVHVAQANVSQTPKKKMKLVRGRDAMKEANDVYAFGWGEWGQNGLGMQNVGDMEACLQPKILESLLGKHVVQCAMGWSHSAVLLESGDLLQYGNRIGTGLNEDWYLPSVSAALNEKLSIASVACGAYHTAALTERGHCLTWGCNLNGQLGHGDTKDLKDPKIVEELKCTAMGLEIFLVQVVCGANYTAALADDGCVYTWGCGDNGVLGQNDTNDRLKPTLIKDLQGMDIVKIAAGGSHMFACTNRETYAWGWNGSGQLGLGHEEDQHKPQSVEVLRGHEVKDIAAGAAHSFALVAVTKLKTDILYSWGSNACGQLGQGKKAKAVRPTPVGEMKSSSDSPVVEIACGAFHTVIRTSNGEVLSCGSNKYGQLGHGNNSDLDEFALVEFLKDKICRSVNCGGESTSILVARAWVEDSEAKECMACKSAFTFVNRKHHCRNCGGIFCNACSSKKMAILKIQVTEPVRVCNNCYTMLGGR